jgi:hypothetical protein
MKVVVLSWNRHMALMVAAGIDVDSSDLHIGVRRVMSRHTIGWSFAIFVFFSLLVLADFPLWQRVALASLLAVAYGTSSIRRIEEQRLEGDTPRGVPLFGNVRDAIWYRVLASCEWLGYLLALTFFADLVFGAIG